MLYWYSCSKVYAHPRQDPVAGAVRTTEKPWSAGRFNRDILAQARSCQWPSDNERACTRAWRTPSPAGPFRHCDGKYFTRYVSITAPKY